MSTLQYIVVLLCAIIYSLNSTLLKVDLYGRKMHMCDMSDKHLANTIAIAMIKRKCNYASDKIIKHNIPEYRNLLKEADKRFKLTKQKQENIVIDPVWTTKGGERITISDMSDRHLLNTARILKRKKQESPYDIWIVNRLPLLDLMEKEIKKRRL